MTTEPPRQPGQPRPAAHAGRNGNPANGHAGCSGSAFDFESAPSTDYDALADLFLGDTDEREPPRASTPPSGRGILTLVSSNDLDEPFAIASDQTQPGLTIEGLIIGHLPVLASAWVSQYARYVAEQVGKWVGLVRIRSGHATIELVGPPGAQSPPPGTSASALKSALAHAAAQTAHWIIRVDELSEPRLAELQGVDRLTLLSGADEAAVVASYRTLKLLSERATHSNEPTLGVAIVGAPKDRAKEAAERLARTVEVHLGQRLRLTACIPQIGPGRIVPIYRGDLSEPTDAALPGILQALRAEADAAQLAAEALPPPPPPSVVAGARAEAHAPVEAAASPAPPEALSTHVPGLKALPARCPLASGVELAIDGAGRVHALARLEGGDGRVMERLLAASAWAGLHADWIRLATGNTAAGGNATAHIFTEDARSARPLLDSEVRVHLLVRARAGDRDVCVCRDLN
jgi:hypothetical protein